MTRRRWPFATTAASRAVGLALVLLAFAGPAWSDAPPADGPAPAPGGTGDDEAAPAATGEAGAEGASDPQAAALAFDAGEVAREEERWKDASDAYWRAVEKDRGHWLAHVRYQEASLRAGALPAGVVEDYDSFVKEYPAERALRLHRIRLDKPSDRLPQLEALLKETPKDADVLLETGRANLQAGAAEKAVKPLATVLQASPARTEALLLLAEAEFRSGKGREARLRLEQALAGRPDLFAAVLLLADFDLLEGKYEEAGRRADAALAMRPSWVGAFLTKAEALDRLGQRDAAIAVLQAARAQKLEVPAVLVALGDLQGRDGTEAALKAAEETYALVVAKEPKHARALYGQGWVLERQKRFEDAEKKYREAATGLPGDAAPVHSVGYCLFKQGKIGEAQTQFRKAMDLDPGFVAAMASLGATYDAQANYAEAVKWYEKLLKVKGHENNLRAIVNLAFDHEQLGAFPKAEDYLRRARKIAPDDPQLAVWLGDNLFFQEKYKDAEKLYSEAVQLDPKSFYGWRGLGYSRGKQKEWADAVEAFEKAREIKPEDHDVLLALGDIYCYELEELEKALERYEAYVAAGGNDPAITQTIQELRTALGK